MATDKTTSFPVRIPTELDAELDSISTATGLSKQDVMRLCLRIGIVDLKAAENDLPGIVQRIAEDKGTSFTAFANAKQQEHAATRKGTTYSPGREGLGTSIHSLNEEPPPPAKPQLQQAKERVLQAAERLKR